MLPQLAAMRFRSRCVVSSNGDHASHTNNKCRVPTTGSVDSHLLLRIKEGAARADLDQARHHDRFDLAGSDLLFQKAEVKLSSRRAKQDCVSRDSLVALTDELGGQGIAGSYMTGERSLESAG